MFVRKGTSLTGQPAEEPNGLAYSDIFSALNTEEVCDAGFARPSSARRRSVADDDMSDDDADAARLSGMAAKLRTAPTQVIKIPVVNIPETTKPAQVTSGQTTAMQVSECKSKIAQLQQFKEQKLQQEDYMGAHHIKQMIQEQEEKLQQLRQQLDSMPTPARLAVPGNGSVAPPPTGGRRGPRVSLSMGPKRKREQSQGPAASTLGKPEQQDEQANADEEMPQEGGAEGQSVQDTEEEMRGEGEAPEESDDEELEAGQWRGCQGQGDLVELPSEKPGTASFQLPRDIFERLYPYQRSGVAWMARLYQNSQGGILADEMGLGKTIQVCALLNGARKAGATHALLLLPVTLLDQWAREARIWCPGWPIHTYYGSQAQRVQALRRVQRPEGGILITSYSMLGYTEDLFDVCVDEAPSPRMSSKGGRKGRGRGGAGGAKRRKYDDDDAEDAVVSDGEPVEPEIPACGLPSSGTTRPWDIVVCDEAHKMKNISTLLGKSLRSLTSRCRILLTGTPVQNALQDLWALMDFAQPGLLGNHATFVKTFSEPIDRGSVRGAKVWAVELKKHLAAQLRSLISPHLLRRTKAGAGLIAAESGVVDECGPAAICDGSVDEDGEQDAQAKKLPPKKETIVWLSPSAEQMSAYQKILEKSEVIKEACSKSKLGVEVFRAIGLLKRLCNHPMLLLPTAKPGDWAQLLSDCQAPSGSAGGDEQSLAPCEAAPEALAGATTESDDARAGRAAEMMLRKLPRNTDAIRAQSAKLRCLSTLLPALAAKGHRTLVFSGSLKMLDLIQISCLRPNGLPCLRIDGQTDPTARAEKVAKFQQQQSRFKCMLLTTSVGGVGLNLTSADRVVLVDPAWNPATDAQAVDRAFRIGQEKEVRVYRLIMSGLIEDKMFRLQVFKMGLTKTALEAGQHQSYFTAREIRALFEWTDPAEGETRKLLVDKHGETGDKAICDAAEEDGSAEGWMEAGPAVALSDFSMLYGCSVQEEEEKDENCEAQVAEAKQRLGAADEKLQRMQEARKAAEAHSEKTATDLKEATTLMDQLREKRTRVDESLREARGEASQARRAEASAQQRQEKASRNRTWAQEQYISKKNASEDLVRVAETASGAVNDVANSARVQEEALVKSIGEVEGQLAAFDESGKATQEGPVDAAADKWRKAMKALEKFRGSVETVMTRQAETDSLETELVQAEAAFATAQQAHERLGEANGEEADAQLAAARKAAEAAMKNREKEKQRTEAAAGKLQPKLEAAREALLAAAQGLTEAGVALADSFRKTEARPVKSDKVKEAQTGTKAIFRQVSSTAKAAKIAREAWAKAVASRRRAQQKAYAGAVAEASAEAWLQGLEMEFAQAAAEAEARRGELSVRDAELAKAEAARSSLEVEEAETKKRKDDLKAAKPAAIEAVKAAKAAEKEACNERQALHMQCSKVEKAHQDLETAKNCAVQTLRAEEYDAKQVEKAYERQQKGSD